MPPLADLTVVSLAINLPGPVAAARLCELGASVVKIEPPGGDPLAHVRPEWYRQLHAGQKIVTLDLKTDDGRTQLHELLASAHLFLTSSRPAALERLQLSWPQLHNRHPHLSQVAIVGDPSPHENRAGHDLTYQARWGLVTPPNMPRTLVADMAGAQEAALMAIALLLARQRGQDATYAEVSLSGAARRIAGPLTHGLTAPGGELGGGFPGYGIYECREGWIAVAALEPHFTERMQRALGIEQLSHQSLSEAFAERTAAQWEQWAAEHDLPLAAVRDSS